MTNENELENPTTENPGEQSPPPIEETEVAPEIETELLAKTLALYDELQDKHLRLMAEYDNFRKRSQREKDETYATATAGVLLKLLGVQDNFERAQQYDCGSADFAKGFELTMKSFADTLASFGVEPFGEVGESFDPEKHHAVMHIEDDNLGENTVALVLQKGYKMGEKVLRCAMVQTAN
ncbi:MAG: nucleotide exchange factor GrpE [Oscillospiraceae bacterium]|nr:nucleotide exchange factor GrpE [Oscillospiraceae bacterium]